MASSRLLRVVPGDDPGWDVVVPRSGEKVGSGSSLEDAVARATELLSSTGGGVQVLNREGFVTGRRSVAAPPEPARDIAVRMVIRLSMLLVGGVALGWLLRSPVPLGPALGVAVGGLVGDLRRRRAARRSQQRGTSGEPG